MPRQNNTRLGIHIVAGSESDMRQLMPVLNKIKHLLNNDVYLSADKGFDSEENRVEAAKIGLTPQIPRRVFNKKQEPVSQDKDAHRWKVERTNSWLNAFAAMCLITTKKPKNIYSLAYSAMAILAINYLSRLGLCF